MSPYSLSSDFPAIARELDASEQVMWAAQPDPGRMQTRALKTASGMVFLFAFSLFWMWGASTPLRAALATGKTPDAMSVLFPAFGLIFVGVAAVGLLSPLTEKVKASRTFYALTDRRALLIVTGGTAKIQSVLPQEFSLERAEGRNGRGDLVLKRETKRGARGSTTIETGFFGIENAREVERLARELAAH